MTNDEKINLIIQHITKVNSFDFNELFKQYWEEETEVVRDEIIEIMLKHHIIKHYNIKDSTDKNASINQFQITILGERILANGGWIHFLESRNENEQTNKEQMLEYESLKTKNKEEKNQNDIKLKDSLATNKVPGVSKGDSKKLTILLALILIFVIVLWIVY